MVPGWADCIRGQCEHRLAVLPVFLGEDINRCVEYPGRGNEASCDLRRQAVTHQSVRRFRDAAQPETVDFDAAAFLGAQIRLQAYETCPFDQAGHDTEGLVEVAKQLEVVLQDDDRLVQIGCAFPDFPVTRVASDLAVRHVPPGVDQECLLIDSVEEPATAGIIRAKPVKELEAHTGLFQPGLCRRPPLRMSAAINDVDPHPLCPSGS